MFSDTSHNVQAIQKYSNKCMKIQYAVIQHGLHDYIQGPYLSSISKPENIDTCLKILKVTHFVPSLSALGAINQHS